MFSVKSILHPTDFSPSSAAAFSIACALARDYGARLVVLHVLERPLIPAGGVMGAREPSVTLEDREAAKKQLAQIRSASDDIRVEHRFEEGDITTAVLQAGKELQSDLIVMGSHGRTGLGRLVMGSVAEKVLRQASCPVLVVKQPAH